MAERDTPGSHRSLGWGLKASQERSIKVSNTAMEFNNLEAQTNKSPQNACTMACFDWAGQACTPQVDHRCRLLQAQPRQ